MKKVTRKAKAIKRTAKKTVKKTVKVAVNKAKRVYRSVKKRVQKVSKEKSKRDKIVCIISGKSKKEHYARNKKNIDLPKTKKEAYDWSWDDSVKANAHQFSSKDKSNTKYVSPDGKREVIFDKNGEVVTDPRDAGTYNYAPSNQGNKIEAGVKHAAMDIVPYVIWGISKKDAKLTNQGQRAAALLGIYL